MNATTTIDPYAGYDDFGGEMDTGRYDSDDVGYYGDSCNACRVCGGWSKGRHAGKTAGVCRFCCPIRRADYADELAADLGAA